MAGEARNLEIGAQGTAIVLDAYFRTYQGGPLVDTDSLPTIEIRDPTSTLADAGTAVQVSTGVYQYTFSIPIGAVISNQWTITWSTQIAGSTVPDATEFFQVVAAGSIAFGDTVTIASRWMDEIKKVLAFPTVDTILLSDDEIKKFCIYQALWTYFNKFPIKIRDQVTINRALNVEFPDYSSLGRECFGAVEARVVEKLGQTSQSSFWDIVRFKTLYGQDFGSGGAGFYKTGNNFNGLRQSFMAQKQTLDTFTNEGTFKYFINYDDRQIEMYSSITANAMIVWAVRSTNFADVKDTYKYDVVQLAQAQLFWHLARTTGILSDSALDQTIDSDSLKAEAETLHNEVMDRWREIPDMLVIRHN